MRRIFGVAVAGLMLGQGVAFAQAPAWTVDPKASHLGFQYLLQGSKVDGAFAGFDATIRFAADDLAASSITVDIPLASVSAGAADRDEMLVNREWFNVKAFPQARFVSKSITAKGDGSYEAVGTLAIKGVSVPVTLPFTLAIKGDQATAKGRLRIDRNRFKIGEGNWAKPDYVGLDVDILVDITAHRQP